MTPAPAATASWKTYTAPNWGLVIRYTPNWAMVTRTATPVSWVAFYPPSSDPNLPSPNITIYYRSQTAYPAGLPTNIIVAGVAGHQSQVPNGFLGSDGSYDIVLSYRTGSLEFSLSGDLGLKGVLKTMLGTLQLHP